jgi:hypothetical protein
MEGSDLPVGAAEHQDLNQLLEDHPIGYAGRWQPKGWSTSLSGSKVENCSQMGSY